METKTFCFGRDVNQDRIITVLKLSREMDRESLSWEIINKELKVKNVNESSGG